jgi:Cdc6-like AAA superfamily ATPase
MKVSELFKKRSKADATRHRPNTVGVQTLPRDARRRASEKDSQPKFQTTASDQLNARNSDPIAVMRSKLRNAFAPSQPVAEHRMFAGRDETLRVVIRSIEDQRLHVVIYGERGIGKTSVLHMLTQSAVEARYIVIYTSCGANSTFDETFRAASSVIPLLYHSDYGPTSVEAERGETVADLLPASELSPRQFGDICAKLTGTRVLIILDEFDRCESGAFRRDVAEIIKNLSDRQGRVQLVLAGVAADLTQLVEHIPSIRRNVHAMRIPKMTDGEIMEIVANGERAAGFVFDPGAGTYVASMALGSPYIANLLCHHAGHAALDAGRSVILPSDVSAAIARAVIEFQGRIPQPMQAHIHKLFEEGLGEAMANTARTALARDGAFKISELTGLDDLEGRKAKQLVDALTAGGLVAVVDERDGEKRYGFVEEGLSTYLWLYWAQQQAVQQPSKARAAART